MVGGVVGMTADQLGDGVGEPGPPRRVMVMVVVVLTVVLTVALVVAVVVVVVRVVVLEWIASTCPS